VEELLFTICAEFGITCPPGNTSIKVFVDCINAHLLDAHAKGRQAVLIIDEAQNLSADVLEQMRLLTNLETNERKLLQIILLGQPELAEMLERPELRQLAQRIIARYHLGTLSKAEVAAYVRHRLEVAGTQHALFPPGIIGQLHRLSGGVPRLINVLCDRALLGTFVQGKERVDRATLAQASREVLHLPSARRGNPRRTLALGLLLLTGAALAWVALQRQEPPHADVNPDMTATSDTAAKPKAKEEAALPASLTWPSNEPLARSKTLAYMTLLRAWGADYQGGDVCRQAEGLGLRCRVSRGGLDELRQLNRPAVLNMHDAQGREFLATLISLGPDSATFSVGTATQAIALGALAAQWSGHYSLLWRMPAAVHGTIRPGDHGPDVAWLRGQLAQLRGGEPATNRDAVFDEALLRQVKQFQLDHGLIPDGSVGPETLIRLVGVMDRTAPMLTRTQEEN
jgi:general secretion pathway protein A